MGIFISRLGLLINKREKSSPAEDHLVRLYGSLRDTFSVFLLSVGYFWMKNSFSFIFIKLIIGFNRASSFLLEAVCFDC
jgi:hypothetical protein